jgi:amino acid transporter
VLIGRGGTLFVEIAAMISTYGWISASLLNSPRFILSLANREELPAMFGKLHDRFNTPSRAIVFCALLEWLLATTGSFRWALLLSSGAQMIYDGAICAALLRLRRVDPAGAAFRVPFGPVLAVLGIVLCAVLLGQVELKHILLMSVTALLASANWFWTRRKSSPGLGRTPPAL